MTLDDAWVLTIGDELLRGEIVDSNKSFFSDRLLQIDLETARHVTIADDPAAIREQLLEATSRARIVLISGGLGPTRDDLTTRVVADTFGLEIVRDPETLARIEAFFRSVGRGMTENNAKQADFPGGAEILPNPLGTAPGFMLEAGGAVIFCTPGVPRELYRMVDHEVLPRIEARFRPDRIVRATLLRTFGLGESALDRELDDLARDDDDLSLGFRTQFPDNLIRVVARGDDAPRAEARLREAIEEIRTRLGPVVVGEGDSPLEEIVGKLLIAHKRTVGIAESLTGGLIGHLLTELPGSSAYLMEGLVCYSNASKIRDLGVDPVELETHGAVSEAVVRSMASAIRERACADLGIATTGIAGPGGGSDDKPVGTVWVGLASAEGVQARAYRLLRDRTRNKRLAAQIALEWLRRHLLGIELPDESFPRLRGARS